MQLIMNFSLNSKRLTVFLFIFAIIFLMIIAAYGKAVKPADGKIEVSGDWEIRGNVNKLYDTPMGEVYDFTMSDHFDFTSEYLKEAAKGKYALNSIQFDLRKSMNRHDKIRRFIVLDFKVRTFPAITPVKTPMLRFMLTRSAVDPGNINDYLSLNGFFECQDVLLGPSIFSAYTPSTLKNSWTFGIGSSSYSPHYEVTSYRVILDTYKGGIESVNVNGSKTISQNSEDPSGHNSGSGGSAKSGKWMPPQTENVPDFVIPVRSFGICIQIDPNIKKRAIPYRTILEVSHPLVTLIDREDALRDLSPVDIMVDYPYDGYAEYFGPKEIKKTNNPDAVYAYAMHLLEGEDLPLGVEMLKKAAGKQHLFAMYQLGVCYYRGIGVVPDLKQALEWLKHASDYDLPDALALAGIIQMNKAKSIYLTDHIIGSVKYSLNALKINTKHDNWALSGVLNNGGGPQDFAKCSPLLGFLGAKRDYIFSYYKDNVDPKILPPPPKPRTETPPSPKLSGRIPPLPPLTKNELRSPSTNARKKNLYSNNIKTAESAKDLSGSSSSSGLKKHYIKSKTAADIDIEPSVSAGDLPTHKLPNKYYDIRVEGFSYQADADEYFKDALANNYLPAILYQGRTTLLRTDFTKPDISLLYIDLPAENSTDALKKTADLFDKGAKLGSLECEVEALHCRVRLGTLKKEDFTAELDVRLADYPLYHMLKYMVENPDAPGVKEFLSRKYEDARQIWRDNPTAWNNFLLGAEALYQYYDYGFDTAWYRLYYRDIKDVETAFKYLDVAAKQNIVPALYLAGKQLIEGMRNKTQLDESINQREGTRLLKAAEQAGDIKASYLLIKDQFDSDRPIDEKKWLEAIKPACDAKYADAWLLAGDIYSRLKNPGNINITAGAYEKAFEAYEKAAQLGSIRAWHSLGMLYYKKSGNNKEKEQNKINAKECWQKFIKLDREARKQDFNEVYWPNIKKPAPFKLDDDADYSIGNLSDKEVRRYYETY